MAEPTGQPDVGGVSPPDARTGVLQVDARGNVTFAAGDALPALGLEARRGEALQAPDPVSHLVEASLHGRPGDRTVTGPDGSRFTVRCRARDGTGVLVTVTEERPEANPFACVSPENLLFSQVSGALWATDRELRLTAVLGRVPDAPSLQPDELVGHTVEEVLGTGDPMNASIAHHREALAGRDTRYDIELGGRTYEVHLQPLRDARGAVEGTVGIALDVTERLETQRRLSESEARLAEAQRVAHVGSWVWDVESNRVTWTDELHHIYGVEPGTFLGSYEAFLARVHPDDLESTRNTIFNAFREGRPFEYDHRIVRPDGAVRMLHTRGALVKDGDRPVRMLGSCWDTTDLWEATRARERTVSLLQATLEATADGLLVVDRDGNVTAVNQRFLALWQIPDDMARRGDDAEMLAFATNQLESPETFLDRVATLYHQPGIESVDVLRFKDGRVFERYSRPQRLGDEVIGRVWSFRDVTERERLLRRAVFLSDASRLLCSLDVEEALDAVAHLAVPFVGDACAIDLFGGGAPRRLMAVSRDPMQRLLPEIPRTVYGGHSTVSHEGGVASVSVPIMARGEFLGALSFAAGSDREYGDQDVALAEELARRAALALENAQLYRQVSEELRARTDFLSIAAHEIRGPITSIHLATQALRSGVVGATAAERFYDAIEREDRRLARFVDELLDVGRIRAGQLRFQFSKVDLANVVREVVARMGAEVARSGSTLSVETGASVEGLWDAGRLDQVVTNLLSNALKFGLGRPIVVQLGAAHGVARLVVQDLGVGIQPEVLGQAFEPFKRGVSARHYGGLGLGLYIVKTIVDGLGGTVRLESELGEGTTVTVELPQERDQ